MSRFIKLLSCLLQEVPLSDIVLVELAKNPPGDANKPPHVFEIRTMGLTYFVGEDPTFGGKEGNIVASQESGVGLEQAKHWEQAIRQALMPVTHTTGSVREGKAADDSCQFKKVLRAE